MKNQMSVLKFFVAIRHIALFCGLLSMLCVGKEPLNKPRIETIYKQEAQQLIQKKKDDPYHCATFHFKEIPYDKDKIQIDEQYGWEFIDFCKDYKLTNDKDRTCWHTVHEGQRIGQRKYFIKSDSIEKAYQAFKPRFIEAITLLDPFSNQCPTKECTLRKESTRYYTGDVEQSIEFEYYNEYIWENDKRLWIDDETNHYLINNFIFEKRGKYVEITHCWKF